MSLKSKIAKLLGYSHPDTEVEGFERVYRDQLDKVKLLIKERDLYSDEASRLRDRIEILELKLKDRHIELNASDMAVAGIQAGDVVVFHHAGGADQLHTFGYGIGAVKSLETELSRTVGGPVMVVVAADGLDFTRVSPDRLRQLLVAMAEHLKKVDSRTLSTGYRLGSKS